MPSPSGSGLLTPFQFRRRRIGSANMPLVIQAGLPAATAPELPYGRCSGVKDYLTDSGGLTTWKIRGHMWAVAHDPDVLLAVQAIHDWESDEGKQAFRQPQTQAEIVAGMIAKRERGTAMHSLFVSASLGRQMPATLAETYAELIAAHQRMISLFIVTGFEMPIVCDELGLAGSLDIIGSPRAPMRPVDKRGEQFAPDVVPGDIIIIDVKTSSGCDYMGDHSVQIYPYAASVGYREVEDLEILREQQKAGVDLWTPEAKRARVGEVIRTPHGARTDVGLIFHADSAGTEVHLHWLNLVEGADAARHAMKTKAFRSRLPHLASHAEPPALLEVLAGITTRDEAVALYRLHREDWTQEHTDAVNTALGIEAAS